MTRAMKPYSAMEAERVIVLCDTAAWHKEQVQQKKTSRRKLRKRHNAGRFYNPDRAAHLPTDTQEAGCNLEPIQCSKCSNIGGALLMNNGIMGNEH